MGRTVFFACKHRVIGNTINKKTWTGRAWRVVGAHSRNSILQLAYRATSSAQRGRYVAAGSHTVLSLLQHNCEVTIIDNLDNAFEVVFERMQKLAGDKAHNMKFIKVRQLHQQVSCRRPDPVQLPTRASFSV